MQHIGKRHIVIPDAQVKEGVKTDHLEAAGNYIAAKRPDVVVCLGDFADMPSLSTHQPKGHIDFENKRYRSDVQASYVGMQRLMNAIEEVKNYKPQLVMTLGNHEDRITRTVKQEPKLKGTLSLDDLCYEGFGWKVYPFLKPAKINGIMYSHYYPTGIFGRPIAKAARILATYHQSAVAGHQQGRDIAYSKKADGNTLTAIIAGSFYEHEEDYLDPISNNHWRGIYVLNEVRGGSFDEMPVSLNYLKRKYL